MFSAVHIQATICDLGLAAKLPLLDNSSVGLLTTVCGTHDNRAPEMVLCGHNEAPGYGTPADMWQVGVVLFEMLTGRHPFARSTEVETLAAILAADFGFQSAPISDMARDLVCRLLVADPAARLTALQCQNHEWIFLED